MLRFLVVLFPVLLGSCAHFGASYRKSCDARDWAKTGSESALKGEKFNTALLQDCEKRGGRADKAAFENGYASGLLRFCTADYGVYFGREGNEYRKTCPASVENSFLAGYSKGKMEYERLQLERSNSQAFQSLTSRENNEGRKCSFNSDCEVHVSCEFSVGEAGVRRCGGNGTKCNSNSDCTLRASCVGSVCR